MLTREQIEYLEDQADLKRRENEAWTTLGIQGDRETRHQMGVQARVEAEQDRFDKARERFTRSHNLTVAQNPTRFSLQDRKAAEDYFAAKRADEAAGADRALQRDLAEIRKEGMIGQGSKAAQFNADAAKEGARLNLEAAKYRADKDKEMAEAKNAFELQLAEKNGATQKEIEDIRAQGNLDVANVQKDVENIRGQTQRDVAKATGQATVDVAKANADAAVARLIAAQQGKEDLQNARIDAAAIRAYRNANRGAPNLSDDDIRNILANGNKK